MLVLFYGSDLSASRQAYAKFLQDTPYDHLVSLKVEDFNPSMVISSSLPSSLFGDRVLISVEGLPAKKTIEDLADEVKLISLKVDLVFWVGEKLKKPHPLISLANQYGRVFSFNHAQEEDIFFLLGLVARKDVLRAQFELDKMLKKGVDPYYIFVMILWQIRVLLGVHLSSSTASRLHPFVKKKALQDLKSWQEGDLFSALKISLNYDYSFKSSRINKSILLPQFLSDIL